MITKLLNKAVSYLGAKEPTGDDQFIRYYNKVAKSGFALNVAWCAIYVTAIARMVGVGASIVPTFANCDVGVRWYKSKGRYEKSKAYGGTYQPKRGDVIFYSSKYTQKDSTHVGYIVSATSSSMKAIEGNKADAVAYRTMSLSNKYIIGYGRVADYLASSDSNSTKATSTASTIASTTATPTDIDICTVKDYQKWLNKNFANEIKGCKKCGNKLLTTDNIYGEKSNAAAVVAYQVTCNKKFNAGLVVDGDFGPKSKAFGNRALVKKGKKGSFVYIVQGAMCANGCYAGEFDGVAGSILKSGIKTFQTKNDLVRDGICGGETYYTAFN